MRLVYQSRHSAAAKAALDGATMHGLPPDRDLDVRRFLLVWSARRIPSTSQRCLPRTAPSRKALSDRHASRSRDSDHAQFRHSALRLCVDCRPLNINESNHNQECGEHAAPGCDPRQKAGDHAILCSGAGDCERVMEAVTLACALCPCVSGQPPRAVAASSRQSQGCLAGSGRARCC